MPRAFPIPIATDDRVPLGPIVETDRRSVHSQNASPGIKVRCNAAAQRRRRRTGPLGTHSVVSAVGHPKPTSVDSNQVKLVCCEERCGYVKVVGNYGVEACGAEHLCKKGSGALERMGPTAGDDQLPPRWCAHIVSPLVSTNCFTSPAATSPRRYGSNDGPRSWRTRQPAGSEDAASTTELMIRRVTGRALPRSGASSTTGPGTDADRVTVRGASSDRPKR